MDRQYGDIIVQAMSPEYENIRKAHLEREDLLGLADIRQMMAAIYADNLSRRSINSAVIAGPSAAIQTVRRDVRNVRCHICLMFVHYKTDCSTRGKQHQGRQNQQ